MGYLSALPSRLARIHIQHLVPVAVLTSTWEM